MTSTVDVKAVVMNALAENGCQVSSGANGIVVVTTPDGAVWDFTQPQEVTPAPSRRPTSSDANDNSPGM